MELLKRLGIGKSEDVPDSALIGEITGPEVTSWEQAFLGKTLFRQDAYATQLSRRDDPSKRAYAALIVDPFRTSIDIPLTDFTPTELLTQKAYETTFFGEVDMERYRAFATNELNRDVLLAFLNRKAAGVSPDETPSWFYRTFGVKHLETYGQVFIGSHGGQSTYGYNHYATIESRFQQGATGEVAIQSAIDLVRVAQRSLRHISIDPLPVDAYLNDLQATLKFLPRDW